MNVAALAFAALAIASPATPREDPHIASVERTLGTAVVLAGQPVATRTLAEAMRRRHVPGISIAVIHGGRIAWARGYGVTNTGDGAVTPATRFQAGSISKSIAALGVLRLHAAGRVSLDRSVNDYLTHWTLPDSAAGKANAVTLRGLLSHSAGINVHGFPGYAHDADRFTIARDGDRLTITAPGETPETLYADASGALFALSQDVTYVFDTGGATGRMEADGDVIPFRKIR